MPGDTADVVMFGPKPIIEEALTKAPGLQLHKAWAAPDQEAFIASIATKVRAIAAVAGHGPVDGALMARFPKLEIVSSFGVGYDHIDAKWAGQHGVMVTNTPDVLNEEVADTALGLLLCTVRHLPQAERYLRAGNWPKHGDYPLMPSLRDRTVGIVGMGRIGKAIARRLDAMKVPVVYHSRRPAAGVSNRHYPKLLDMARDVTVLLVITPGGAETKNLINAEVLKALGPDGILINMARGSVVDEEALIQALKDKTILSAGLDVYLREPEVPAELIAMDNIVLFPHLGSASVYTRTQMDQLVVDNLLAWAAGKPPLTPVPETPWRPAGRG
jgi:lactate dehydrogenase-like 2-hydroxyacid dehydrogenase